MSVELKRHLVKAFTWRILATSLTVALVVGFSGDWTFGGIAAGIDIVVKLLLYVVHEQVWYRFSRFGVKPATEEKPGLKEQNNV